MALSVPSDMHWRTGPLGSEAAGMLAQLLQKHALGARVVSHDAVSRAGILSFDPHGVAIVCIAYPEIIGSPSDIRYLVRRLRSRMPKATIVVGFWPSAGPAFAEKGGRDVVGADHYVASLREAVIACLETVRSTSAAALPYAEVRKRPAGPATSGRASIEW